MKTHTRTVPSCLLVCIATGLSIPQAFANCLLPHDSGQHGHWNWQIIPEVQFANLESTDSYFSGDGTEIWRAEHDLDGELYGFTMAGSPPVLGNMITGFGSYREGDLDGSFNTQEITPFPEGPYPGQISFDREEWELGVDVLILNAVYARLAYHGYEMEGDWIYPGGGIEPQKYEFEALEIGVGFRQDFESCYSPDLTFGVDAYLALQFFDYEHTEIDGGATAESSGAGFKGRIEANAKYRVLDHTQVVLAAGYLYQDIDDDGLELTNDGFLVRFGVEIEL